MAGITGCLFTKFVCDAGNNAIFRGSREIAPLGTAYSLTWVGTNVPGSGGQSRYTGIGLITNDNMLVAAFQENA
jgi:hypothetical protein